MTDRTFGPRRPRRTQGPGSGLLAILVGAAALTAACSGSPSAASGAASRSHDSPSPSVQSARPSGTGRLTAQRGQLAYSNCMRLHGVPGVPTSLPRAVPGSAPKPSSPQWQAAGQVNGPNPGSPEWLAAQQACRALMPMPAIAPGA
jgi:hypothetical protein